MSGRTNRFLIRATQTVKAEMFMLVARYVATNPLQA